MAMLDKAFQSTPSAWRETSDDGQRCLFRQYFNPLPPHGGRLEDMLPTARKIDISIHSLRMEGDRPAMPSCRQSDNISIHSLRMEGDYCPNCGAKIEEYFNPLPPHGGRLPLFCNSSIAFVISIHSLRMEGDSTAATDTITSD